MIFPKKAQYPISKGSNRSDNNEVIFNSTRLSLRLQPIPLWCLLSVVDG